MQLRHGDTFVLNNRSGEGTTTWVVVNCPDETITHVVRARPLNTDASLGDERSFFLPELLKTISSGLRLTE